MLLTGKNSIIKLEVLLMKEETSVITTELLITFKAFRFTYYSINLVLIIWILLGYFINKHSSNSLPNTILLSEILVFELSKAHFKKKISNTDK
jgi:uncharacterized membrane protein